MKLSQIYPFLSHLSLTPRQIADFNRMITKGTAYAGRLTAQERAVLIRLLREEDLLPGMSHVITEKIHGSGAEQEIPSLLFAVLAPDWAGLADACLGTVHEAGLNIAYTHGFILRRNRDKLGVVLMEVELSPHLTRNALDIARSKIQERLSIISAKDTAKRTLQRQEARRLYAFTSVTDLLRAKLPPEDLVEIMGDGGEALKFFISRHDSYVSQRSLESVADQILVNYRIKKKLRSEDSRLEVDFQQVQFQKKILTGVTVITREQSLTFDRLLRLFNEKSPGNRRYEDYAYFTADKLSVFHLELTDQDDQPLSGSLLSIIEEGIRQLPSQKETLGPTPGVELVRRKIVPLMIDEERDIAIPQGYIHPHAPEHFKLIMVASGSDRGFGPEVVRALSAVEGLSAAMPDKPNVTTSLRNQQEHLQEISIVDIWIDRRRLFGQQRENWNDEEIYNRIEQAVKVVPGFGPKLRIFDRTSRALRQMRLKAVTSLAEKLDIPPEKIKSLFYSIGDRCLLNPEVPNEAITEQVRLEYRAYNQVASGRSLAAFFQEMKLASSEPSFTALAVAARYSQERLKRIFEAASKYQVNSLCRTDFEDITLLLFNLTADSAPLGSDQQQSLMAELEAAA
jgi:hypothetical protein